MLVLAGGPTLSSGGWSLPPVSALSSVFGAGSAIGSLLKPGVAPVFRFTPLPSPPLLEASVPFAATERFGAGRKELNAPNAPPPVLARFAGGDCPSSSCLSSVTGRSLAGSGRLTRILCGFERSTTFWNAGLPALRLLLDVFFGFGCSSVSEPEDSEYDTSVIVICCGCLNMWMIIVEDYARTTAPLTLQTRLTRHRFIHLPRDWRGSKTAIHSQLLDVSPWEILKDSTLGAFR